jgi:hypothetical protein
LGELHHLTSETKAVDVSSCILSIGMNDSLPIQVFPLAPHAADASIHGGIDTDVVVKNGPILGIGGWKHIRLVQVGIFADL